MPTIQYDPYICGAMAIFGIVTITALAALFWPRKKV